MLPYVAVVIAVWLVSLAVWMVVSRCFRRVDADRMRNRILESPKKEQKERGKHPAKQLLQVEDRGEHRLTLRILGRLQLRHRLEELLEQAGLKWRPAGLVNGCLGLFAAGFLIGRVVVPQYGIAPLLTALAAGSVPLLYVVRARRKRLRKFEAQFPESLEFVARSMRAGHAFSVSLEMIHREFQEPLAGEFRRTFDEHNLGMPLEVALLKLAKRVPMLDVHFFVSAVLLQKRTGGNLAEILDKLAYVIRERFKLRGKIRAISAHGRMTGLALTCIPIGVAVLMFYTNPKYVGFFFEDETGHYMLGAAVILQLLGYAVIRKIVSIEV